MRKAHRKLKGKVADEILDQLREAVVRQGPEEVGVEETDHKHWQGSNMI